MRTKRVIEGLLAVAAGVTLLANTLGALPWRVWLAVFALWPLVIIAAGVDLVGRGIGRDWVRAIASAIVLCGFVCGVVSAAASGYAEPGGGWELKARDAESFEFAEPASSGIEHGIATIRGGAGKVAVRAGDVLAEAHGASAFAPEFRVRRDGATAVVDVSLGSQPWMWTNGMSATELDVGLSGDVPWDLTIEAGAGEVVADLAGLALSRARIDCGASDSTITFGGPDGAVPVEIRAGVSSVTMRFPRDCAFRIEVTGALASVEGDAVLKGEHKGGERTITHGDAASSDRYDVEVQAGVSMVRIELY